MNKWYHFWNKQTGEYYGACDNTRGSEEFAHLEFTPPPMPGSELEDGWYLVTLGYKPLFREKRGDQGYNTNGEIQTRHWDVYEVLKKVTMEDLDE